MTSDQRISTLDEAKRYRDSEYDNNPQNYGGAGGESLNYGSYSERYSKNDHQRRQASYRGPLD